MAATHMMYDRMGMGSGTSVAIGGSLPNLGSYGSMMGVDAGGGMVPGSSSSSHNSMMFPGGSPAHAVPGSSMGMAPGMMMGMSPMVYPSSMGWQR